MSNNNYFPFGITPRCFIPPGLTSTLRTLVVAIMYMYFTRVDCVSDHVLGAEENPKYVVDGFREPIHDDGRQYPRNKHHLPTTELGSVVGTCL